MPIRFLHAADLHLGVRITRFAPDVAGQIQEARFQALEKLKQASVKHQVDFTILAGDIFDHETISTTIADRAFRDFNGKSWHGPVFVLPGNHDPLIPGSVWDRDPWGDDGLKRVQLFRRAEAVTIPDKPVTLYPCPCFQKNSHHDPTDWIAHADKHPGHFAIGIAHGSLNVLPDLPEDDHLIKPDAAEKLGLDYLALGHWHKFFTHKDSRGATRTAYPGTTETMNFPGQTSDQTIGWQEQSHNLRSELFQSDEIGSALLVEIDEPGAPPKISPLPIVQMRWLNREFDLTHGIGPVISELAKFDQPATTIVRFRFKGIVTPNDLRRLEGDLKNGIKFRYNLGSDWDFSQVHLQLSPEDLREKIGEGVLRKMHERLEQALNRNAEDASLPSATTTPEVTAAWRQFQLLLTEAQS